ncbi:hypothetical protein E4U17_000992 [Claviceps sp. LM77 group G4]|nr:hypothetical protein E4U17_000992 [Claviceps sp. LM77 group G4]KAG6066485.1 hypothetical protein E4U33_005543 [Claviceps sp. LM78 group G4]
MDDTVASQAERRRRFQHICLSKESVIYIFQSCMANGAEALMSCLPRSLRERLDPKLGSRSAAKVQADIEHFPAARCDGLVNDDEFLVMVHPAPKTLAYVTALDDLAKWSMETCARNRHPPLTAMSGV